MIEVAARPGRTSSRGKLRDVKRPACLRTQTGALRSCGLAVCQPDRRRVELAEATGALRPVCRGRDAERALSPWPDGEAINPSRQNCAQRRVRSTPTVRRVSSHRGDQPHSLNGVRREEDLFTPIHRTSRGRRALSLRRFGHRCLRRALSLRTGSIPRGRPCVQPGLEGTPPRFLGQETLAKA